MSDLFRAPTDGSHMTPLRRWHGLTFLGRVAYNSVSAASTTANIGLITYEYYGRVDIVFTVY